MTNQYNEDSIQKLSPLEFTRLRPDTYCGSTEDSTQLVVELITNCKDEFLIGNCNEVFITIDEKNNIITVSDEGQGIIPNLQKEDGKTVLEMVYGDINTSGKYDKSDTAVYKESTGAFGIGASLTNFLSHWLTATTKRNGSFETVYFMEGVFNRRETGLCPKEEHGVEVSFQPSEEFFKDAKPNIKALKKMLYEDSCVCPGLKYHLNGEEFYHPNGLKELIQDELSLTSLFEIQEETGRQKFSCVMTYSPQSSSQIIPFCNYALIETGTPITTIKSCLTRTLNKWAKEQGLLKEKDKNLEGSALQEGLKLAFNLSSPNIRYDSQTKVRVTSTEDNSFISSTLGQHFEVWLDNNPADGQTIIERALVARKAAEAAKKARAAVKAKAQVVEKKKTIQLPTTLTDCWSKDRSKCELLICEGKSAASGLVAARDSEFQAVYGVRGKMLSVLKTTPSNIYKNKEINNLVQALGLPVDPATCKLEYRPEKLRYGKIIAAADADSDGAAIENLLFNILWYMCPELIINGHVFSAVPALYKVTTNKNEYIYLKDDNALNEYKTQKNNIKTVNRMKGLGECGSDELAEMLLDPETRNVVELVVEDFGETNKVFQDLYGKAVEPRVRFLKEHSEEGRADYE